MALKETVFAYAFGVTSMVSERRYGLKPGITA
jgi:hypothetical protein